MGSLEEHFQHLNILCLPKLYSFSVGKFVHTCHNKLLPNHFDEYFILLSSINYHSTELATSKNLFLPRIKSSSRKFSLKFIGPKVCSSIQTILNFQPPSPLNGNLRNTSYMKKNPNYELKQHFTWPEQNTVYSNNLWLCLIFVYIYFFIFSVYILCFSAWKYTF